MNMYADITCKLLLCENHHDQPSGYKTTADVTQYCR